EILNAAAQLDGSDPQVTSRLERMCARLEQSQHAAQLVADARHLLTAESFEEARVKAVEALERDPECPETAEVLSAIGDAIERREKQKAIEEQIAKANS